MGGNGRSFDVLSRAIEKCLLVSNGTGGVVKSERAEHKGGKSDAKKPASSARGCEGGELKNPDNIAHSTLCTDN